MRKLRFLMLLLLLSSVVMAQTRLISGTITDSKNGNPVPSATVKVKGRNTQAITNSDGGFSLNVPSGAVTLEISSIGYSSKAVEVDAGSTNVSVTMDASSAALSEVVVTALGISKQARKVGYAVTAVNGDQLSKARENNVALGLEGQVAGLNIHGTNGGPAGSARILLRGVSSLTGAGSPLFVINGVPMDNGNRGSAGEWGGSDNGDGIGNINPDDIESMTVLKGLSASALYGSRAANGVIIITTKTGKKGTANIEYNANFIADKAINSTDFQYVYGQGTGGVKPANAGSAQATARFAWGAKMDGSSYTGFDGKTYSYAPYKNNIADFYRWGPSFTNTLSVNGGGDRGTYRLSASNLSNDAIVRGSGLGRKTVNFNMEQKVTDKLSFQITANYIDQKAKNPPQLSDGPGNPNNGMFLAPNIKETTLAPGYNPTTGREIVFSDDNYVTNPYFAINKWVNEISRKRLITAVSGKYNFTDWLYVQGKVGYDRLDDRALGVTPTGTDFSYNSAGQSGSISLTTRQAYELNLDALLGLTHRLTKDITLDATLGGNSRRNKEEALTINGGPFVIPNLYAPKNVLSFNRDYVYKERAVHSGYYSLDFSYKDFLTLGTTGRYDAFSTLYNSLIPKGDRNIFTPSVSGSFIFSQFMHSSVLSYGKLRASYAKTSGEPLNPYQTAVYYSVGNAINGTSTGSFSGTLPNLFLKPYTLTEFEVGTELKFFNNRLGLDLAYFQRKTSDEIMNSTLSWATGYNSAVIANGSIQNKGFEVLITGTPLKTNNFSWNTSFNLTTIKNKVLKSDADSKDLPQGNYRPLNANTAYVVGLSGPQIQAHDYVYNKGQIEVDNDGLPKQGALINMGSVLPTLYGGFKNDFSFKGFDLSILVDYNFGNKVLSATKYYAVLRGLDKETLVGREGGVKVNGVLADGSANTKTATAEAYYQRMASISRFNALDGDYIKLRQVTLGYTISEKALAKVPVFSSIQISLVGRNLITFLKHTDNIDPESGFSSTIAYAGIEGTSLPSVRSFGINANFKFKK